MIELSEDFKSWLRERFHPLAIPCNNLHFAEQVWLQQKLDAALLQSENEQLKQLCERMAKVLIEVEYHGGICPGDCGKSNRTDPHTNLCEIGKAICAYEAFKAGKKA